MQSSSRKIVTELLSDLGDAEPPIDADRLMPLVYEELKDLARKFIRREKAGHTLQPTALVHEAYMRLVDQSRVDWRGRTHFYAVGAEAMRRVLIDHARSKHRAKRGGGWQRILLDDAAMPMGLGGIDLLELDDAIESLSELDSQQAEIVKLRYFAGLTVQEVADLLGVSKRKVEGDWTHAKSWLRARLSPEKE